MSAARVEELLAQLKINPTIVVELYPLLTRVDYQVFVARGARVRLEDALFLTYAAGEICELPAFTSDRYPLFQNLSQHAEVEAVVVRGLRLFQCLKDRNIVADEGDTQLAINPGSEHGIRLSRAILLSALAAS